jgi:hypothetical protein
MRQAIRQRHNTHGVSLVLFSFGLVGLTLVSWGTYTAYTQLVDARESVNAAVSDALDQAILLPSNHGGAYINEDLNGKDLQLDTANVAPVTETALMQTISQSTIQGCGAAAAACPFHNTMSGGNGHAMKRGMAQLCQTWQQYMQSQSSSVNQSCNAGTNGGGFQWILPAHYMQAAHVAGPITVDAIQINTRVPNTITLFGHTQTVTQPVIAAEVWIPVQVNLFKPLHWNSVIKEAIMIPLTGRQAPAKFLNYQN